MKEPLNQGQKKKSGLWKNKATKGGGECQGQSSTRQLHQNIGLSVFCSLFKSPASRNICKLQPGGTGETENVQGIGCSHSTNIS